MRFWKKDKKVIKNVNNNRINLIIAIIFLFGLAILIRLFNLQVLDKDMYAMLADSQHQISSILEPVRGRIFIQDSVNNSNNDLYPIATNKNFALLYAVPKDVKEPEKIADQLYLIFKQDQVKKEVEELFKRQDEDQLKNELASVAKLDETARKTKEAEIIKKNNEMKVDKNLLELRNLKIEEAIKSRREKIISDYLKILQKNNDPYEPLENKVEEEILKKVYVALYNLSGNSIKTADLEIKNDLIYIKDSKKPLEISGIGFSLSSYRYYPEGNIGSNLVGFVGYFDNTQKGRYGLEEFFDQELGGKYGSIKTERDAKARAIIINDREYDSPLDGSDIILTINRSIQFMACKKLNEAVLKHGADGGSIIIIEPKTGAILAMCSNPDFDPNNFQEEKNMEVFNNQAIFSQYEPGSIFKVITMAMALDQGKITPQTTYNDTGNVKIADYTIENSDRKAHGVVTMANVLELSLNTGAIFAMRQIGPEIFEKYIIDFGFGEKTGIELEGESKGDIINLTKNKLNKELYAATASFGQGIAVTPLQIAMAFAAIANNGILMKPYVVKEIVKKDGNRNATEPKQIKKVMSEKTATTLSAIMVSVVENGHGKKAAVKGYYVGGKTGTAQVPKKDGRGYEPNAHIGSFAGFAPVDDPRFAMLVRIDNPRDVDWAESSAAPLFGELAEFMLNYWQVPKERQ